MALRRSQALLRSRTTCDDTSKLHHYHLQSNPSSFYKDKRNLKNSKDSISSKFQASGGFPKASLQLAFTQSIGFYSTI